MALLELQDVHAYYGHVHALKGISLHVDEGEVVTLLGANGAGKSTTLRTVSGLVRPRSGTIRFAGEPIHQLPPEEIVARGVVQVPEGRKVFGPLTVQENLELGAFVPIQRRQRWQDDLARVLDLFPRLKERRHQLAGTLSGGEQQMLAIGRGLMARPRLLMLDEPSMGLAPTLVQLILGIVQDINRQGTTVLLVEQNARAALRLATRGYVLETGHPALAGPAAELAGNEKVVQAYLGE